MNDLSGLELEVINSLSRLHDIRREWSRLEASLPDLTPFQTPEWLLTWWHHFGGGELQVYAFRAAGRLVAIVPAFLHHWEGRRQLTLIGSGISDYLDPLIAAGEQERVVRCLREHLQSQPAWDICIWQDLSADTPLAALGHEARMSAQCELDQPCSAICIDQAFADYWAARPSGLRRNERRYRSKAEQLAPLVITVNRSNDKECVDALVRLHSARWREQGEPGMIAANRSANFLRDIAQEFALREMLLLFSLRFQGEIAAVILGFPYRNVIYAYLSAFDPSYGALGFGRLLLFEALQYAFKGGYSSWNFLRGSEAYKFDWGAREILKSRLVITRVPEP